MEYRGYIPPDAMNDQRERRRGPHPVPEREIKITFAHSGGPGGQNVNKRDTKAVLHWNMDESPAFNEEEKAMIRDYIGKRMSEDGVITLYAQQERSQLQNKAAVTEMLQDLVCKALVPPKERKATRTPRASKERRLEDKHRQSQKKRERRGDGD